MRARAPDKADARRSSSAGTSGALPVDTARYARRVADYLTQACCAACASCHNTGWVGFDPFPLTRPTEAAPVDFDFGFGGRWPCPGCTDLSPPAPLRTRFASQLDADLHVAGQWWAMRAVGVHFDVDGVHRGEARQQRALDRLRFRQRKGAESEPLRAVA